MRPGGRHAGVMKLITGQAWYEVRGRQTKHMDQKIQQPDLEKLQVLDESTKRSMHNHND